MVKVCYRVQIKNKKWFTTTKLWLAWQIQKLTLELRCHVQYYVWTMYITFSGFILKCIEYLKDFLIF